jgi:hypothetical protein
MANTNIPSYLQGPLGVILEAVDSTRGVETTPIPMSVNQKDIDEDPDTTKAVLFKAKIHVNPSRRTAIRDEIVEYLNGVLDRGNFDDFVEVRSGTPSRPDSEQFDFVVKYSGNKAQVIRILVKPTNAGGSGGGAAKTKIQEVGQALFAAIRYLKNKPLECHPTDISKCLTDADFEEGMKYVDCNNEVKIEEITGLEQEWKDAFILGANKIYDKIGGSGYEFLRGDKIVDDGALKKAFTRVKKNSPTAPDNEDKWNPSDIWMIKSSEKDAIVNKLKEENTIDCLNEYIASKFQDKGFIGLSLKKLGSTARWTTMNPPNTSQLDKAKKVRFIKSKTLQELTAFSAMDVYFVFAPSGSKNKDSFQARNFAGTNRGDWKLEIKGEFAAQGKIQGQVMRNLLTAASFSKPVPDEPSFNDCKPQSNKVQAINEEIFNIMNGFSPKPKGWNAKTAKAEIRNKDASWKYSKLAGLRLLEWLMSLPQSEANRAVKEMYLYASSQTDKSSVHYKIY